MAEVSWVYGKNWMRSCIFSLKLLVFFRVDGTMAVLVKDAVIPKNAPTSLLLDQHAGFIAK